MCVIKYECVAIIKNYWLCENMNSYQIILVANSLFVGTRISTSVSSPAHSNFSSIPVLVDKSLYAPNKVFAHLNIPYHSEF